METFEAIKKRRSFRTFSSKPILKGIIEKLVDCARFAPTARNLQPWEFVAITRKDTLKAIAAIADNGRFISGSSCCIAVLSKDTKYYLEDGCAATENILIAAADLGLGACWVAGDKKDYCEQVIDLLEAPPDLRLVSLIALGYTESSPSEPAKRQVDEILHWDRF